MCYIFFFFIFHLQISCCSIFVHFLQYILTIYLFFWVFNHSVYYFFCILIIIKNYYYDVLLLLLLLLLFYSFMPAEFVRSRAISHNILKQLASDSHHVPTSAVSHSLTPDAASASVATARSRSPRRWVHLSRPATLLVEFLIFRAIYCGSCFDLFLCSYGFAFWQSKASS